MYIPKQFRVEDKDQILEMIRSIHLGAVVLFSENRYISSHIPLLAYEEDDKIILEGHIAKGNELSKYATEKNPALIIFQGPHTYIHPGWYAEKEKTGKVVPTWNYVVIHCHGFLEKKESSDWILDHLEQLTNYNEAHREKPWKVSDAPKEFTENLSNHIVGLKMEVHQIDASWKMNQHHSEENRLGVIKGLNSSSKGQDQEVANVMKKIQVT